MHPMPLYTLRQTRAMRLLVTLLLVALGGCTLLYRDLSNPGAIYYPIAIHNLHIGDSKAAVIEALGMPSLVKYATVIGAQAVDAWRYEQWNAIEGRDERGKVYDLYFVDGKLAQVGLAGSWSEEKDAAYGFRQQP